ncbi:putative glyoxal reductase [Aphelenchoides bicaudatus]|nr:putative glyoxal reductase [Aphelenchoides bicaudatus]
MDNKGRDYVRSRMPKIGLGTYLITDEDELRGSIEAALKCGYRFFDTAQVYRNEDMVGEALRDFMPAYELSRKQIFVTSKLNPKNNGAKAYEETKKSVETVGLDYLDLYLLHWPGKSGYKVSDKRNKEARKQAWQGLEKALDEGLVKAIGVSNFQPDHLDELMEYARVRPSVNQCEFHPAYCPQDVLDSCEEHGIAFQAYSSFGSTEHAKELIKYEPYRELTAKYDCTTPQLLLAWSLSQGYSVLPKSTNPSHIRANLKALNIQLTEEDIESMKWENEKKFCWNPRTVV